MPDGARTSAPTASVTTAPDAATPQRQRSSSAAPTYTAPPAVSLGVTSPAGPGASLPAATQRALEASFGVDLSSVRVHSDAQSTSVTRGLSARAFTYGPHIHLGPGERPTDIGLMAHEVAHVVQQRSAPAVQLSSLNASDAFEHEAQQASSAVLHGESASVRGDIGGFRVQRLGISDALNFFADRANLIPGFRMFTIILGLNPINMSRVERSAANILRALVEFIPGGGLITQALDNYGIFERVGAWIETQINALGMAGSTIRRALDQFLGSLSFGDIFHLGDVWERAKRIFTEPIDRLINFARGVVTGILRLIKDAILRPLARLAEGTRGYDLLKAVLGQDPITGEPFPRNAETLIGGFMKLIGQEEVWNNLKRANAVARAWAWFQGALSGLLGYVRQIPGLFISALQQLELMDIVLLPRAFSKVARVFGGFFSSFFSWAGQQVLSLLQIIFEVVAPAVMPYIRRAAGALRSIIENPVRFVGNLVRAGIQGFRQFAGNFLNHLRRSLIEWLTGTLSGAGVYIPQAFELREIVKFVLSVLGLTWQNIRQKLVRLIPEPAVQALETGFDIVVTLVREGPAAAWEKIRESLSNLRDMVMEQIMTFVRDRIVQAAITRLITSLNPAGAFIQAIIATYNTVMFFVERMQQIVRVVMSFIDSIAAIASGNIGSAASRVETTMAGLLTLVISFLARIAGLGRVSDAVKSIIDRVRQPIDRALDRVVTWVVDRGRSILARLAGRRAGPAAGAQRTPEEKARDLRAAVEAGNAFLNRNRTTSRRQQRRGLDQIRERYQLTSIEIVTEGHPEGKDRVHLRATINPTYDGQGHIIDRDPPGPRIVIVTDIAAPQPRQGFEEVLEPVPLYQRAHLIGAGFGRESPLGVLYAPPQLNQELQNRGIEQFIRGSFRERLPGVTFTLRAESEPRPGSGANYLARVRYTLFAQRPNEPQTELLDVTIYVRGTIAAPVVRVVEGENEGSEVVSRYTTFVRTRLARLGIT